jgi:hypothetical protein
MNAETAGLEPTRSSQFARFLVGLGLIVWALGGVIFELATLSIAVVKNVSLDAVASYATFFAGILFVAFVVLKILGRFTKGKISMKSLFRKTKCLNETDDGLPLTTLNAIGLDSSASPFPLRSPMAEDFYWTQA